MTQPQTNQPSELEDKLDKILRDLIMSIAGYESDDLSNADKENLVETIAEILALLSTSQREAEQRMLDLWKGDILSGFTPKCLFCGTKRKVVGQTTKGKDAQDKNHLPRNWGYYCQDCYNEGSKIEYEAMYG